MLPERALIRHLKHEENDAEWFMRGWGEVMKLFLSLWEVHVVCLDPPIDYRGIFDGQFFNCPHDNVRFIDNVTGFTVDGFQLDMMV